jgi:hypothetical protein
VDDQQARQVIQRVKTDVEPEKLSKLILTELEIQVRILPGQPFFSPRSLLEI